MPSLLEMLKAGVHFGHQKSRWHPKMEQYIFGARGGVHVVDLEKTQAKLQEALDFVRSLVANGKTVLFVGTKRQAQAIVKAAATDCGAPFLTERWIGGLLTNFDEAKIRLKKYLKMKEEVATGEIEKYIKKEQGEFKKKLDKMDKYLNGLANLDKLPDAIFITDMRAGKTAVVEATKTNVPIIGICDTNVNPEKAAYPIPANDDAVNSIRLIVNLMAEAVKEGKAEWEKNKLVMAAVKPEIKVAVAGKPVSKPVASKTKPVAKDESKERKVVVAESV
ncbi:MAG: 30S ribosomal protein S2 [Candidatus Magasanikbacteria bacterium RIFOXYC2_FULL_42_28]|uniref:Small ribosomal subunit protein uS2 n=1 Tax=Candidatus Magasanikbacteria bacterium RIFOXYC2_FULL_42_28 TaxID=1798704 RepID=A0A1F6NY85_9BACT|nr:MAG: 30S ribosomal protein S2 [Candidatus Magasanikbacteria bacterium RIFOXYC2_FULL_42_28]